MTENDRERQLPAHKQDKAEIVCCSQLQLHLTLNHGYPPPDAQTSSSDGKTCSDGNFAADEMLHNELRALATLMQDIKAGQNNSSPHVEKMLSNLETRVIRLEKQLEMALNSIYTLVQLQTGMNSSVTRFKEDCSEHLKAIRASLAP
ncbi:hypothetical protein WR25_22293 [Diploscapter pachys]|uniref:Uncharacterized protein n=1 Tax=Diploscapter pachys TaxID=2018661 RepID=A0A2A2JTV9_9BILA|nr:hypothetical protein WR25_22293 [Diploscapter pachys]